MVTLTGKQKRFLRARGQTLQASASIGKAGLSPEAVRNLKALLTDHELIKIRLPEGYDRKALAADAADATQAALAGVIGRTCLLYKPNESLDDKDRLALPK
jgi:RNA-binding protein